VELLKATIAQISIFEGCSDPFIVAMASLLEMMALPAQTTLFSVGDDGDAMYVVHSGVLAIVIKSVIVREIRKGACFGELSVFSSMARTATVESRTYVILYTLSRFRSQRVLEGYPECAAVVAGHVQEVLNQLSSSESSSNAPFSTPPSAAGRGGIRRASVAAGVVAGAAALAKGLKGVTPSPSRRRLTSWLGRKSVVSPAQLEFAEAEPAPAPAPFNPYDRHHGPKAALVREPRRCIDHHSRTRLWWLLLLVSNLCYCWLLVPVQVTFPLWQRPGWAVQAADTISNAGLWLDLVLNFRLSFMVDTEKITDPRQSARRYLRRGFLFDLLCALPYEYVDATKYGLLRTPRLLRALHLRHQLKEIAHFIAFNSRRQLVLLGAMLFMLVHIVTCVHFAISYFEGFNPHEAEAWISPISLCLRRVNATQLEDCNSTVFDEDADRRALQAITVLEYSRSLYYAVGVLASPGKSVEPTTAVQLAAALVLMLSGFLITAIVVDNVQKRFTASAFEQKAFFSTSSRIQLFLRRQNAPLAIHQRVRSFLDYWWSSHRGAIIGELLADLPRKVRIDLLRSICLPVLQTLALLQGVRPVLDKLEELVVENAQFILYGQGEIVYRHGDSVTGMFFLLEGEVCVVEKGESSREVPRGAFFGTAALAQQERGEGYMEHVSANSGCILLLISRDQLQAMEALFPLLKEELRSLEQRLLGNKLSSMRGQQAIQTPRKTPSRVLHLLLSDLADAVTAVHDPESRFILVWETWIFIVTTMQWALVMFQACFPMEGGRRNADSFMLFLEMSFVLDIHIRSRLGFYEFGSKIMDPGRIKRKYVGSYTLALDLAALVPLYIVNWVVPSNQRWDLLNANKLLRLLKVPRQLHALEWRYLKRTTELRLFKLLYYTFMLSHFLGCVWFNFASREAIPTLDSSGLVAETAFGDNHWLPSQHLEHGPHTLQYMASLYWSFGLMSASSEPEFPKTTAQCVFSATTMTTGFFLFAYVIGNFTDIIELNSAETKEFNAKMRAVRKMLALPDTGGRANARQDVHAVQALPHHHPGAPARALPAAVAAHGYPSRASQADDRQGGVSPRDGGLHHAHARVAVHASLDLSRRVRVQVWREWQRHVLRLHGGTGHPRAFPDRPPQQQHVPVGGEELGRG
jgi:CRP-like cAMP-binding protein